MSDDTLPHSVNSPDMKILICILTLSGRFHFSLYAQLAWRDTTQPISGIEWSNYSTSYLGAGSDSIPLLVTAIPYNGIYSFGSGGPGQPPPMDMTFTGSAFQFQSNLTSGQTLYTYDSSAVYFLVPGLFRYNADRFKFRVVKNDSALVKSWSSHLTVEIRRRKGQQIISRTTVYWLPVMPVMLSVFTPHELSEVLLHLKVPFNLSFDSK